MISDVCFWCREGEERVTSQIITSLIPGPPLSPCKPCHSQDWSLQLTVNETRLIWATIQVLNTIPNRVRELRFCWSHPLPPPQPRPQTATTLKMEASHRSVPKRHVTSKLATGPLSPCLVKCTLTSLEPLGCGWKWVVGEEWRLGRDLKGNGHGVIGVLWVQQSFRILNVSYH
jgi:hypothetical protein